MIRSSSIESPCSIAIRCSDAEAMRLRRMLHARLALDQDLFRSQGLYLGIKQEKISEGLHRFGHSLDTSILLPGSLRSTAARIEKSFEDLNTLVNEYLKNCDLLSLDRLDKRNILTIAYVRGRSPKKRSDQISIVRIMNAIAGFR